MSFHKKRSHSKLMGVYTGLSEILGEESLSKLMGIARLRRAWSDIVGPMMAARTEPILIEHIANDGLCLWIAVDHPIMAQQIRFLRDDIRKACFKQAGIGNLHKISTRIQPDAGIKAKKAPEEARRLSLTEKRKIAQELSTIKDRDLRKAAYQAYAAQIAYADKEEIQ